MLTSPTLADAADIVPRDGTWLAQPELISTDGCPPGVGDQVSTDAAEPVEQDITFPDPFDPADVLVGNDGFVWTRLAANEWRGLFEESGDIDGVGTLATRTEHDLTVLSDTAMEQDTVLTVEFPAQMQELMGTEGPCRIVSRVSYGYVGN